MSEGGHALFDDRQATDAGLLEATHTLGMSYRYGRGVRTDLRRRFRLCLAAAKGGVSEAQFSIDLGLVI